MHMQEMFTIIIRSHI